VPLVQRFFAAEEGAEHAGGESDRVLPEANGRLEAA